MNKSHSLLLVGLLASGCSTLEDSGTHPSSTPSRNAEIEASDSKFSNQLHKLENWFYELTETSRNDALVESRSNHAPVLSPDGSHPELAPEQGELKAIPAPATPHVQERALITRDPQTAQGFAIENTWFHENLWLYPDGSYSLGSAQNTKGHWSLKNGILNLSPNSGGRQLYQMGKNDIWHGVAGTRSQLRPRLH